VPNDQASKHFAGIIEVGVPLCAAKHKLPPIWLCVMHLPAPCRQHRHPYYTCITPATRSLSSGLWSSAASVKHLLYPAAPRSYTRLALHGERKASLSASPLSTRQLLGTLCMFCTLLTACIHHVPATQYAASVHTPYKCDSKSNTRGLPVYPARMRSGGMNSIPPCTCTLLPVSHQTKNETHVEGLQHGR
jgi:hypothetical protein